MNARTLTKTASALAISTLAAACGNALADVVGPALPLGGSTYEAASIGSTFLHSTDNGGFVDTGDSKATAVYTGNDGSASITIKAGSPDSPTADARVTWSFEVLGPAGLSPVPLILLGKGYLKNQWTTSAGAMEDLITISSTVPAWNSNASIGRNSQEWFNIDWNGQVFDNQVYQITLAVDAYYFGPSSPDIEGWIDPAVNFADGFDSSGYSIVSSPVPNAVSAVPEPGMSGMLLAGGCGLLALCRRRSARASASR